MGVNDQIKELQGEFRKNGLNLYLQGEGESPPMHEMDGYLKGGPIKFPVGSVDILPPLRDALNQKRSAMLMKNGNFWDLFMKSPEKEGGCFIATAAFGSQDAFEVEFLRNFRDEVLLLNPLGRVFVKVYYYISPPIANLISKHKLLRKATRVFFIEPIVKSIKFLSGGE